MAYLDVPAYMAKIAAAEATIGRDAQRFTILNAVRSTHEDLEFLESVQNVQCWSEVPAAGIERIERILLSADRIEGTT